jgi:energy-coupling factor transport system permease protein
MIAPTLYQHRESGLHRLNPLTKGALLFPVLAAAAALPKTWAVLAVYLFVLLPLAFWGRVFKSYLPTCLKLIWPFALSLFLIQGFFAPGEKVLLALGPFSLTLEGIDLAAAFASRILLVLGAAVLVMYTTRPDMLAQALTEHGFPRAIAYIVVTAMQIIPRFQTKAQIILDAQQARGLETQGNLGRRAHALVPLVGPLLLGSIVEVEERAIALEARAFSCQGPKTSLLALADSPAQKFIRWLLLAAALALPVLRALGTFTP